MLVEEFWKSVNCDEVIYDTNFVAYFFDHLVDMQTCFLCELAAVSTYSTGVHGSNIAPDHNVNAVWLTLSDIAIFYSTKSSDKHAKIEFFREYED